MTTPETTATIETTTAPPSWDLSDLFGSLDDPRLDAVLAEQLARAKDFAVRHRGHIGEVLASPSALLAAIREFESILQEAEKPVEYAGLMFAAQTDDPKCGALKQRTHERYTDVANELKFFTLELGSAKATLLTVAVAPELAQYRVWLTQLAKEAEHFLTEPEEKIFSRLQLTGRGAFIRLFTEEMSAMRFGAKVGDSDKSLTQTDLLHLIRSPEREARRNAAESLTAGLDDQLRRSTFITNVLAQDWRTIGELRGFAESEDMRHLDNLISGETVQAMVDAVVASYPAAQRYYHFKREVMGLPDFFEYDRNAPISTKEREIQFSEAKQLVLGAFGSFSSEFAATAQQFFDRGWIDAVPRKGKRGGAFCSYATADLHPYVLLSYQGRIGDVNTLAHELGHGVHASLAGIQTNLTFATPLTMAETASVFGEMALYDAVKDTLSPEDRFALLMERLDDVMATVYRQVSMFLFERDLHDARRQGEVESAQLNEFWLRRQTEFYGDSVTLSKGYAGWWSYIPHFIHTPFYVYAYAFGLLLVMALYAKYRQQPEGFAAKYLDMLRTGGTKTPQELVAPFGITLDDPEFWRGGVRLVEQMINEAIAAKRG